ncbi:MAG TPA: Holliday junction resolvase RuvX [Thermoanaerobaculia bacterium]|nr:Holliday junction resolvase RuvX [Thermoanaerobaculia bacterium]HUM28624.1 Holliday junction resolvase RuvX [Thermoanaerobaculia bacterium]HXK66768.1 Holliday junction resolvase RuvX [Thermoanaerobaculia bacterium]
MRILAVDFGTRRMGLASWDTAAPVVIPINPITGSDAGAMERDLARIIQDEAFDRVVLGLPLNMDGTEGAMAKTVRELGSRLSEKGIDITYMDERLTSREASNRVSRKARRSRNGRLDSISASLILEAYVETLA